MNPTLLARLVEAVSMRLVELKGRVDAQPSKAEIVAAVLAGMPVPKDGVSPDIDVVVNAAVARMTPDESLVGRIADALVKAVPRMKDGRDGIDGIDGVDGKDGVDGIDGIDGKDGEDGERGPIGPMPKHKWKGTALAFETEEGVFGDAVDLRGPPGKTTSGGVVFASSDSDGAGIDDDTVATDSTWSSQKISDSLAALAPEDGLVVSVNGQGGAVVLDAEDVGLGAFAGLTPENLPLSYAADVANADLQGQIDAIPAPTPHTTVNSRSGNVTLTAVDVGLDKVANLTPAQLPVSDLTATAIATAKASAISSAVTAAYAHADEAASAALDNANAYTDAQVGALLDAAPGALDTLNELAAALGDDPNFATTVTTNLASKEAKITAGATTSFWNGGKVWTDFATTVRASVLTGLSLATSTVVAAADTVLVAIGKLQAQITATNTAIAGKEPTIAAGAGTSFWSGTKTWVDFAASVRATVMTGVVFNADNAVVATDTLIAAVSKLQSQITSVYNVTQAIRTEMVLGAWVPQALPVAPFTGSFTNATASGRFRKTGRTVDFTATVETPGNGTGNGAILLYMPYPAAALFVFLGREANITGTTVIATMSSNVLFIRDINSGYPGGDGRSFTISGVYEATI